MGRASSLKKLETLQGADMPDPTKEMRYILDLTRPYDNLLATEGNRNQKFIWGNELLSASGESSFHYLQDHLGSPIRLMGESESDTLAYDEFGVPLVGAGKNIHQPFGFTGYQMDEVSGLYYAQARYFSAENARFISEDYVRDGVNWYVHCENNSIAYYDPDGCAKLRWNGNNYRYHASNKTADVGLAVVSALPFAGVAVPIAKGLTGLVTPDEIDLKSSRDISSVLGNAADVGSFIAHIETVIDIFGASGSLTGAIASIASKLGWIGSALGFINILAILFDSSYTVQQAVELSGAVQWTNAKTAIALALAAEQVMANYLASGAVSISKDGYSLIWHSEYARQVYYKMLAAIKSGCE